jgi:hypothetical protein
MKRQRSREEWRERGGGGGELNAKYTLTHSVTRSMGGNTKSYADGNEEGIHERVGYCHTFHVELSKQYMQKELCLFCARRICGAPPPFEKKKKKIREAA